MDKQSVKELQPTAKVLAGLIASGAVYVLARLGVSGLRENPDVWAAVEVLAYFAAAWLIKETHYVIVQFTPEDDA